MDKVLLIDKPAEWSSFDVVAKIRGALRQRTSPKIKVGHSGTLDPFATGLLIVLIGAETKNQESFMKLDKEYEAVLRLGYTSSTGDPEGTVTKKREVRVPERKEVENALLDLTGEIMQTPPAFSAIKINGQRAYSLARKGEQVVLKARLVRINYIEITNFNWPSLSIKVGCSSGTYIRTLAEQIGEKLSTGAYLTALRRTKIGEFDIKDARKLEEVIENF